MVFLAELSIRHPRTVLCIWLVILAPSVYFGVKMLANGGNNMLPTVDLNNSEYQKYFTDDPNTSLVVLLVEDLNQSDIRKSKAVEKFIEAVDHQLEQSVYAQALVGLRKDYWTVADNDFPTLAAVFVSSDHTKTFAYWEVAMDDHANASALCQQLMDEVEEVSAQLLGSDYRARVTGYVPFIIEVVDTALHDRVVTELSEGPLTTLILWFTLPSWRLMPIPLVLVGSALLISMALLYPVNAVAPVHAAAVNIMMALGVALMVDYCVLLINRWVEEYRYDQDNEAALIIAVKTSGGTISISAIILLTCFSILAAMSTGLAQMLGIVIFLITFVSVTVGLTALPALLALFGDTLGRGLYRLSDSARTPQIDVDDEEHQPLVPDKQQEEGAEGDKEGEGETAVAKESNWVIVTRFVIRYRYSILTVILVTLVPVTYIASQIYFQYDEAKGLPDFEALLTLRDLEDSFGKGKLYPYTLMLTADGRNGGSLNALSPEFWEAGTQALQSILSIPGCDMNNTFGLLALNGTMISYSQWQTAAEGEDESELSRTLRALATQMTNIPVEGAYANATAQKLQLVLTVNPVSIEGAAWLKATREMIRNIQPTAKVGVYLLNGAIFVIDTVDRQIMSLPMAIGVAVVVVFTMIGITFNSFLIPLWTSFSVFLTLAWTFAVVNLVATDGLLWWIAMTSVFMVIGFAFDFDLFVLTRIIEYSDAGYPHHEAIVKALHKTGPVVTSAGLVLASAFVALLISQLPAIVLLGVALLFSMLFDTFVVRSIVVPVMMAIMSDAGRWPTVNRWFLEGAGDRRRKPAPAVSS